MRRILLFFFFSVSNLAFDASNRNFSSCIHRRHAKCVLFCGDGCHSRWLAHVRLILKPSYYWSTIIPLCNLRNWSIQKLKEYLNSSELIYSETEKYVFRTSSANSSLFFRTSSAELILCAVFCDSLLESMKLAIGYLHWSVMLIRGFVERHTQGQVPWRCATFWRLWVMRSHLHFWRFLSILVAPRFVLDFCALRAWCLSSINLEMLRTAHFNASRVGFCLANIC